MPLAERGDLLRGIRILTLSVVGRRTTRVHVIGSGLACRRRFRADYPKGNFGIFSFLVAFSNRFS